MGNIPNNLHLPPFCDLNETTQSIKVANKFCCFLIKVSEQSHIN